MHLYVYIKSIIANEKYIWYSNLYKNKTFNYIKYYRILTKFTHKNTNMTIHYTQLLYN